MIKTLNNVFYQVIRQQQLVSNGFANVNRSPYQLQIAEKEQMFKFIGKLKLAPDSEIIKFNDNIRKSLRVGYTENWMNYQTQHLEGFYTQIRDNILIDDNDFLNESSSYFFNKEGKLIRPILNTMIHEYTKLQLDDQAKEELKRKQLTWASVIEVNPQYRQNQQILHVSSLIHDDILDDSSVRRGLKSAHLVYGKKLATFSANYMIGRAGRAIATFNDIRMFQVYSNIMENLTHVRIKNPQLKGEYLQAMKQRDFSDFETTLQNYMLKTYYKTASLIAHSLVGVCELNQIAMVEDIFKVGLHLGIAFQLVDDVLDFTSNTSELGKQNMNDLKSGVITGPVLLEYFSQNKSSQIFWKIKDVIHKKKTDIDSINEVNRIVLNEGNGIQKTQYLAYLHVTEGIHLLKKHQSQQNKEVFNDIMSLIDYILNRKK